MKTKSNLKISVLAAAALLVVFTGYAAALEVPELRGRVNDYANILTASQRDSLETVLRGAGEKTSSQVALLTVTSLDGEVLEDFSLRVAEQWKLGQEEFDNGVLLLVAMAEKKMRIEVGYGLESIVTDLKSGYIIREIIVKEFKRGRYYDGIHNGLQAVTGLITKEFQITPQQLERYKKSQRRTKPLGSVIFMIVMALIMLSGFFRSSSRRGYRRSGVYWGSSYRGGGGGFSGGGFSGGGGSFGGGGASGGW
jgi:uncharacterized protein